jgi:hypothetical protein
MNTDIEVKAAFALELARSTALQELLPLAPRSLIEMVWQLGYLTGKGSGIQHALDVRQRSQD